MFCQKYCFTKILHATGKSRKQFRWPLGHRPGLLRKKEEWEPPNWQGHRAKHQEPGQTWEASPALGVYQPDFRQTHFPDPAEREGPSLSRCDVNSNWQGHRKGTQRMQKTTVIILNNRVSNLKVTEIIRCFQTLERSLLPLGERQWNSFLMFRWLDTSHLTTVYTVKPPSLWILSLEKQRILFYCLFISRKSED